MTGSTTSAEFFEAMYREKADPWDFAQSEYEQSRYGAILAALGHRHYERAFEPGCSIGELTRRLAERCDRVSAIDLAPTAVLRAREKCDGLSYVDIQVGSLPHQVPEGMFDLIMFSEIGYYFEQEHLRDVGGLLVSRLQMSGTLLAAHWLGTSEDHLISGDCVHAVVGELSGLRLEYSERNSSFRLDRWVRV